VLKEARSQKALQEYGQKAKEVKGGRKPTQYRVKLRIYSKCLKMKKLQNRTMSQSLSQQRTELPEK